MGTAHLIGGKTVAGTQEERRQLHLPSTIQDVIRNNIRDLRQLRVEEELFESLGEKAVLDHIRRGGTDPAMLQRADFTLKRIRAEYEVEFGIGSFKVDAGGRFPIPATVQAECAAATGLSRDQWQAIESDTREVSVSELVAIAAYFHVDPAFLLAPPADLLEDETPIRCGDFDGAKQASSSQWLLWIRGVAPLPSQDPDRYERNMALATVYVDVPHNTKSRGKTGADLDTGRWLEQAKHRYARSAPRVSGIAADATQPGFGEQTTAPGELLSAFVSIRRLLRVERDDPARQNLFTGQWQALQTHLVRLWNILHIAPGNGGHP